MAYALIGALALFSHRFALARICYISRLADIIILSIKRLLHCINPELNNFILLSGVFPLPGHCPLNSPLKRCEMFLFCDDRSVRGIGPRVAPRHMPTQYAHKQPPPCS